MVSDDLGSRWRARTPWNELTSPRSHEPAQPMRAGTIFLLIQPWGIKAYDPRLNQWWDWDPSLKLSTPWDLSGQAVWTSGRLLFFHDCSLSWVKSDVSEYVPGKGWIPVSDPQRPNQRKNGNYFVSKNQIVAWGGENCSDGSPLFDGSLYNPDSNRWTKLPTPPSLKTSNGGERRDPLVTIAAQSLFVWGGWSERSGPEDSPHERYSSAANGAVLNLSSLEWEVAAKSGFDIPNGFDTVAVSVPKGILVYDAVLSQGAIYQLDTRTWTKMLVKSPHQSSPQSHRPVVTKMRAASNGSTALFWNGDQVFLYDGINGDWSGPTYVATRSGGSEAFAISTSQVSFWTGTEWILWFRGQGYRYYP